MGLTDEHEFDDIEDETEYAGEIGEALDEDDDEDIAEEFVDNGKGQKVHKPEKVEIQIRDKNEDGTPCRFGDTVEDVGGQLFVSVSYMARRYGGSGGHIGEEDIQHAIAQAKICIEREGDIPIVKDYRVKESLSEWFGG